MLSFIPSLVLFLLIKKGKSENMVSHIEPADLKFEQENICNEYVGVDFYNNNPLIYKKRNIKKGTVICINSSNIYMSIIFHSWQNFEAKTFRTFRKPPNSTQNLTFSNPDSYVYESISKNEDIETKNEHLLNEGENDTVVIEDGPYNEKDSSIIGFYFGRSIGQVQLKALKSNAVLSFGLILFNEKSTLRIISNNKEDSLKFKEPRSYHEYSCQRHIQYFNGLPGSQSYNIDMNIDEEEDYINFRNSKKCSMNYTGELSIQKKTTEEEPQILNFYTSSRYKKDPSNSSSMKDKKLDVYLQIEENSNLIKSKKYGRMWTSSGKYSTIPAFNYNENYIGWIILTVVLCVVFVVLVVALIAFIVFKKRKTRFVKCNDSCQEGIDNNIENEGQTSKSTKAKRRMLFESVVGVLHSPKNKKDEPQKSQNDRKDDGISISQSKLLDQENGN